MYSTKIGFKMLDIHINQKKLGREYINDRMILLCLRALRRAGVNAWGGHGGEGRGREVDEGKEGRGTLKEILYVVIYISDSLINEQLGVINLIMFNLKESDKTKI